MSFLALFWICNGRKPNTNYPPTFSEGNGSERARFLVMTLTSPLRFKIAVFSIWEESAAPSTYLSGLNPLKTFPISQAQSSREETYVSVSLQCRSFALALTESVMIMLLTQLV